MCKLNLKKNVHTFIKKLKKLNEQYSYGHNCSATKKQQLCLYNKTKVRYYIV